MIKTNHKPRALIISPNWLGDAIMAQPLLEKLACEYELAILAPTHLIDVYHRMPYIQEVFAHTFTPGKFTWRAFKNIYDLIKKSQIGQTPYQAAYILPNSFKSALLPFVLRIPQRFGYNTELRSILLTQYLSKIQRADIKKMLMVNYYLNLLNAAHSSFFNLIKIFAKLPKTIKYDISAIPKTPVLQRNLNFKPIDFLKEKLKLSMESESKLGLNYIIIAPGAEFGEAKRWPTEYFSDLIIGLQKYFKNLQNSLNNHIPPLIILLGVKNDQKITAQIMHYLAQNNVQNLCFDLAGQTTLAQALDLISHAQYAIVHDSGLMHAASAFSTPLSAIYGSTSQLHTPPMPSNPQKAQVLKLNFPCQPCFQKRCPFETSNAGAENAKAYQCLKLLTPDFVLNQVVMHFETIL